MRNVVGVDLIVIYQCFCDRTRLRILNLLLHGPLCVCHFQKILGEPQVKVSKHLAYLKTHGLVEVRQEANWRVYSLVGKPNPALRANLACLQDCATEDKVFRRDTEELHRRRARSGDASPLCSTRPQPVQLKT